MDRYFRVEGTLAIGWKRLPIAETFLVRDDVASDIISTVVARRSEQYFANKIRGVVWRTVTIHEVLMTAGMSAVELPPEPRDTTIG